MNPPEIIVGVDGSVESGHALRWAAGEAARRRIDLAVLHVYDWRIYGAASPIGAPFVSDAREIAEAIVASAVDEAKTVAPGVRVRGEALLGSTVATLVAASSAGAMLVVGNRGRGGFASLLLGSVSQQVATHAAGPVVVVRGRWDGATGPVVVGVDGSDASVSALGAALAEAEVAGSGVVAVRAYGAPAVMWGPQSDMTVQDTREWQEAEHAALAADVAAWKDKYPDVAIETVAVEGHAGEVLAGVSASARLVVVGHRGHGGFTGLLLGSVGLQLLHHADCPVLIARDGPVVSR